ncbi:SWPV1-225 [Shearwaterpox virus]|uniref:SWPV1-225 n=1 Tax=Shearwaterpox virus TaxID=1974596 RepID=A0A1V0S843_CNPV|nr:SWPV1-225 [Shearwaterpox virus]
MDPFGFIKNRPSYVVVLGIILLIVACIFAYIELNKTGKAVDIPLRAVSIVSFILGMILLLGIVFFTGYNKFCNKSMPEESVRYATSNDIEVQ